MIAETIITTNAKIAAMFLLGTAAAIADTQFPVSSVEDYTAKGLLGIACVVLYRLLMKSQADAKDMRDKHEDKLMGVIEANTKSNERVCELAEEQSNYFKTVTRHIVDEKLKGNHPTPP